jgi:hypothetical protein
MTLRDAVHAADLPAILERLYPTSGARAGKRGRVRCVWRGGDDFSGSVYQTRDGAWRLRDFVSAETYDAFDVLVLLGGLSRSAAAQELIGDEPRTRPKRTRRRDPTASALPAFPDELLALVLWSRITRRPLWPVDGTSTEQGRRALELLADWLAASIALEMRLGQGNAMEPRR